MRGLFSVRIGCGLLALALLGACAGRPRSQPVNWQIVADAPGDPPTISEGHVVLQGQPIRSRGVYTAPVSLACRVELEQATGDEVAFVVALIPADGEPTRVRIPWGALPLRLQPGRVYLLNLTLSPKGRVTVNDLPLPDVTVTLPEGPFQIELAGEPVTSRWRLRGLVIE